MRYSFFISVALTVMVALAVLQGSFISFIIPFEAKLFAWGAVPVTPVPELPALARKARVEVLEEENRILQKMLRLPSVATPFLAVPVLGYELGERTHVIIGKGSNDGITVGEAVVTPEGVLIGEILAVHTATAVVRTIIDPDAKFSGAILAQGSLVSGVIEGVHGVGLHLTLIPRQDLLQVGDLVVTAGEEVGVPRGIPVGTVAVISETPGIPLKEAILTPLASFHNLVMLAVVRSEHVP